MNTENEKIKIKDLAEFQINPPYEIMVDLGENAYWESGMITKYKGKDVMIIECKSRKFWRKIINETEDGKIEMEDRSICTLLIIDL